MIGQEYIWSTSEKSRMRAEALNRISIIVGSYGGHVEVDMENEILNCVYPDSVSEEDKADCAQKCEKIMLKAGFSI